METATRPDLDLALGLMVPRVTITLVFGGAPPTAEGSGRERALEKRSPRFWREGTGFVPWTFLNSFLTNQAQTRWDWGAQARTLGLPLCHPAHKGLKSGVQGGDTAPEPPGTVLGLTRLALAAAPEGHSSPGVGEKRHGLDSCSRLRRRAGL